MIGAFWTLATSEAFTELSKPKLLVGRGIVTICVLTGFIRSHGNPLDTVLHDVTAEPDA